VEAVALVNVPLHARLIAKTIVPQIVQGGVAVVAREDVLQDAVLLANRPVLGDVLQDVLEGVRLPARGHVLVGVQTPVLAHVVIRVQAVVQLVVEPVTIHVTEDVKVVVILLVWDPVHII